jgi:hypothetical protein
MYTGLGANLGNILTGIGTGQAQAITGAGLQGTQLSGALMPGLAGAVPYAGAPWGAAGNMLAGVGGNLMGLAGYLSPGGSTTNATLASGLSPTWGKGTGEALANWGLGTPPTMGTPVGSGWTGAA